MADAACQSRRTRTPNHVSNEIKAEPSEWLMLLGNLGEHEPKIGHSALICDTKITHF